MLIQMYREFWGGESWHYGRCRVYLGYRHPLFPLERQMLRSRLVMSEFLGRKLLPHEFVHHKDRDISNDNISNLEIIDQATHKRLHGAEISAAYTPERRKEMSRWQKSRTIEERKIAAKNRKDRLNFYKG